MAKGALTPGAAADVCVFDPDQIWFADAETWQSQGINTPFWGQRFTGKVSFTLQNGKVIHSAS
jgi:dihydroorotase